VKESVAAANSANSAGITMILVFRVVVVEEVAGEASVLSEANATLFAIRLHLLTSVAFCADQLLELFPVERVRLSIVVAEATGVDFSAAWALKWEGW
jgi:hypothetical protein